MAGAKKSESPHVTPGLAAFCAKSKGVFDAEKITASIHSVFGGRVSFEDLNKAHGPDGSIYHINTFKDEIHAYYGFHGKGTKEQQGVGKSSIVFKKSADGLEAFHEHIELEPGRGYGPPIILASLKAYESMGVKRIKLLAGLEVGRYFWAKLGWKFSDKDQEEGAGAIYNHWLDRAGYKGPHVAVSSPQDIADHEHEGRKYGKQFMLSDYMPTWKAQLPIDRDDKNYQRALRLLGA
jgi:hypothetical protein